jgi:DNA-binding transcriptional ArsR family regulator
MGSGSTLTLDQPQQLKALGHPLRLRVLDALGDNDRPLTNRELAKLLDVDPGHLHFHVRMLLNAGLIERVEAKGGREKPYRAVAANIRVAPELLASAAARDAHATVLQEVNRGYDRYAGVGDFRSAQITVRMDPSLLAECVQAFCLEMEKRETEEREPLLVTVIAHPQAPLADLT